ncbi:MAG: cache domain-containing protein [Deltaproteobacteria bacterium]
MSKNNKDKQFFGIGGIFFLLIVIPLSLMAFLIANGMFKLGVTIKERAVSVLDQKSQEEIKIRAINTADEVANFLNERRKDVLTATIIPANDIAYKQFLKDNNKNIWIKEKNKIKQISTPLYTEMALIDKTGKEVIKIAHGQTVPASKLNIVGMPSNTTYKTEEYFDKTKILNKGEIYISPVTGWYVSKAEFEKGARFSGIIRLATPLFDKQGFAGMIVLALDYRHLAEFTNHIIPTQQERVFEADAATGNYTFMVDGRGFVIAHPNTYHIAGINRDGTPVRALSAQNAAELTKKGDEVLNLNQLGFMDPNLPVIAKESAAGKAGILTYKFRGLTKFVAYAPIKFYTSNLPQPAGFGWIGMGLEVEKYNEAAIKVSKNIEKEAKAWTATLILILIASMIILFLMMLLLARGITRSIQAEVPAGSEGSLSFEDDDEDDK